ncbi:cyclic 3',5'-adenosine monophosphate phosphodiesterase [Caballeronia pedi]|uniref:Cyclic 3',5'-adenosine monophosphate phosphodiesterase n=2 Tax=Caballeronia pedi TaxID=1777141 RepID=A0A158DWT0_9BURK|nr:cyclic 3',5'-adenosine monophosphate phosphodiesterase [Caballeronia pedi]
MLSWVHFGDLHASSDDDFGSLNHLQSMIEQVNRRFSDRVDFAYLPGDNANNGTTEQFQRILAVLRALKLPLYAIPGDHDYEAGQLDAFNAFSGTRLPMSRMVKGHRCIFLDIVSAGRGGPDFRLSTQDRNWLDQELDRSNLDRAAPVVLMHAYPGDVVDGESLAFAFARANVAVVDTGHTHYNELLNDGYVIYAATRSTGQIEEDEGQPGFSIVAVDGAAVSWKFHRLDAEPPFVMITHPCDWRLYRRRVALNATQAKPLVRVLVSDDEVVAVAADLDGVRIALAPDANETGMWQAPLPSIATSERLRLTVTAQTADGRTGQDSIELPAAHAASRLSPQAGPLGSDAHVVEAWPEHGILGSQLGPNKNGRHW